MFGRFSEAAFVFSSISEFVKAWDSGSDSKLVLETRNGRVQMTFTCDLGKPSDNHFDPTKHFKANKPKTKSKRRRDRDNRRAMLYQQRLSNEKDSVPESNEDVPASMETSDADDASEVVVTNTVDEEAAEADTVGDDTINLPTRVEALEQELNDIIERSDKDSESSKPVKDIVKPKLGWDRIVRRGDVGLSTDPNIKIKLREHDCWDSNYDDRSVWPLWGMDKDFDKKKGWHYKHRECLARGPFSSCLKKNHHGDPMDWFFCWRARSMIMVEEE